MINKLATLRLSSGYFLMSYFSIFLLCVFLNAGADLQVMEGGVLLKAIVSSLMLWYALYLSSFSRVSYGIAMFVLAALLTLKIYYAHVLGVHIEPAVFEGMFDTSPDEVVRLGSAKPLAIFLAILLYFVVGIEFGWLKAQRFRRQLAWHFLKWLVVLLVFLGYSLAVGGLSINKLTVLLGESFPVNIGRQFSKAAIARYHLYVANSSKVDLVSKYSFELSEKEPVTVVFVRGESLRSRSFPLDNSGIKKSDLLPDIGRKVLLRNMFSYANYTQAAVPWMLSRSIGDRLLNEKSFISVLRKLGFDTTWLGCDNSNIAGFATPIVNYSLEADRALFVGKLNDWLSDRPKGIVKRLVGPSFVDARQFAYLLSAVGSEDKGRQFYWVEMNGSHVPWRGFDEQYIFGRPLCGRVLDEVNKCSEKEATNSYNSTVLATQYALRKLIETLKARNAVVFFASDHGESTGEHGFYGHGFMLPEGGRWIRDQINPAFMVWMSDRFAKNHPEKLMALRENADAYARHDVIFHSVLDVLGIESEIIDRKKSLFSSAFVSRPKYIEYKYKVRGGKVYQADYNRIEYGFKYSEVEPGESVELELQFLGDSRMVEVGVADFYQNTKYTGRISYELWQDGKRIFHADIADSKGTASRQLIVDLSRSRQLVLKLLVSDKVEKGWAWGASGKVALVLRDVDSRRGND